MPLVVVVTCRVVVTLLYSPSFLKTFDFRYFVLKHLFRQDIRLGYLLAMLMAFSLLPSPFCLLATLALPRISLVLDSQHTCQGHQMLGQQKCWPIPNQPKLQLVPERHMRPTIGIVLLPDFLFQLCDNNDDCGSDECCVDNDRFLIMSKRAVKVPIGSPIKGDVLH